MSRNDKAIEQEIKELELQKSIEQMHCDKKNKERDEKIAILRAAQREKGIQQRSASQWRWVSTGLMMIMMSVLVLFFYGQYTHHQSLKYANEPVETWQERTTRYPINDQNHGYVSCPSFAPDCG